MTFVAAESSATQVSADLLIVINRGKLLCHGGQAWQPLPPAVLDFFAAASHRHYLGQLDGKHCFAVFFDLKPTPEIARYEWSDLRSQFGRISEEYFQLAGRALQITRWYRDHQFCGVCGGKTRESSSDRALVCQICEARFYPRISPCVIGLVKRGNMCLLARSARHPEGMFSTLAGFVEPGESVEQALVREVKEEVGVAINNLRYLTSQPWPFPGQLMLGFLADYAGGEICVDENEILEAHWFAADRMPTTPPEGTIAGRLIGEFVKQTKG